MYREKIDAFVEAHRQELIDDVCELCRINSEKMAAEEDMPFGPGAAECLDAAMDMAEGYEFDVTDYDGYVAAIDLNEMPRHLDILAHLDVVPAGEGWTVTEPFHPLVKDGKIYGRGTADDKGPAIAALYAMRAVKELGIPLKKNVRLILGTDEECGSGDIAHYYSQEPEAPMTFSPDIEYPVVNVEKGGLKGHFTADFAASEALPRLVSLDAGIKINVLPGKAKAVVEGIDRAVLADAAKAAEAETGVSFLFEEEGSLTSITAVGKGAHASTPEEGINAITGLLTLLLSLPLAACEQVNYLKKLNSLLPHGDVNGTALGIDMADEISGRLTLAFTILNLTASHLEGQFDSRVPVCGNEENVLKAAKDRMEAEGFAFLTDTMNPPHHVSGDSDFVRTLLKAYEDYTGLKGECQSTGGGTYVHHLKNGVAFGASMPGRENNMHGANEFVEIEDLVMSAKIFAQVIVDLCS